LAFHQIVELSRVDINIPTKHGNKTSTKQQSKPECWQDRRQIKITDKSQTKHNPEKANNAKQQNATILV